MWRRSCPPRCEVTYNSFDWRDSGCDPRPDGVRQAIVSPPVALGTGNVSDGRAGPAASSSKCPGRTENAEQTLSRRCHDQGTIPDKRYAASCWETPIAFASVALRPCRSTGYPSSSSRACSLREALFASRLSAVVSCPSSSSAIFTGLAPFIEWVCQVVHKPFKHGPYRGRVRSPQGCGPNPSLRAIMYGMDFQNRLSDEKVTFFDLVQAISGGAGPRTTDRDGRQLSFLTRVGLEKSRLPSIVICNGRLTLQRRMFVVAEVVRGGHQWPIPIETSSKKTGFCSPRE